MMTNNETTKAMKTKITHFLYLAAVVLLTACSKDDDMSTVVPPLDNGMPLTFTITDDGFSAGGNSGTRAAEEGYKTTFTAGDACGLYIVRNGEVKNANVKLTATQDGENVVWTTAEELKGTTTDSYYLYYPYQADMDNKVSAAAGADDRTFFGNLISGWEVKTDQSEYADYTASDLMTAKGEPTETEGTISLTFSTVHHMALAVIEMPKATYHFTNTSPEISDYVVPTSNPEYLTVTFNETTKPWQVEENVHIYRYIINPANAQAITGSYKLYWEVSNKNHSFTIPSDRLNAIAAGKGKKFKIDGGIRETNHYLQLGDYLCKDGTLISKETTLTNDQKNNVAAIVFYAGHNDYDGLIYDGTAIDQETCHGYAVALNDVVNGGYSTCSWGKTGETGCYVEDNKTHPEKDWKGLVYANTILMYGTSSYPATYFALIAYENTVPRPATCTSWFLPAIGQLKTICVNNNELFKVVGNKLYSAYYWSSSEDYNSPENQALIFNGTGNSTTSVVTDLKTKTDKYRVRAVLAF